MRDKILFISTALLLIVAVSCDLITPEKTIVYNRIIANNTDSTIIVCFKYHNLSNTLTLSDTIVMNESIVAFINVEGETSMQPSNYDTAFVYYHDKVLYDVSDTASNSLLNDDLYLSSAASTIGNTTYKRLVFSIDEDYINTHGNQ
jgi:hypothetical protein